MDEHEDRQIIKRRGPDDRVWYVVAEAQGMTEAEIVGGLLRTAGIPVYFFREALGTALPVSVGLVGGVQVAVPEQYYDEAMALLEGDEDNLLPEETGADFVEAEGENGEYDEFDGYEDEALDEE
jgi:hypothetical protein